MTQPPVDVPNLSPDEVHAQFEIQPLTMGSPWRWLRAGWADVMAYPGIAVFYGAWFCMMAWALRLVFHNNPEYTLSAVSGCLLVGPFLTLGLYDVSMRKELGEATTLTHSLFCWRTHVPTMGMLVMVMIVLELLWGRASLVVFAVFFNTGLPSTASVLEAVFNPQNWEFVVAYLFVGGFFAGLVFASMMVAIPMILHRDTDAITACVTSLRVFVTQTGPCVVWALIIFFLVMLALWPWGLGLLVVGPWLGFATWYAYRDAVVQVTVPSRMQNDCP